MERSFDDAAMLHFIRDSLFRSDSPLHHEFLVSLETFIAERIASRESEWFPCLSRDLHSCLQKLADTQAKVIELEQRIDALHATAASATAQQLVTESTLCSPRRKMQLKLLQTKFDAWNMNCHNVMPCSTNLYELRVHHLRTTSSFQNHNHSYIHNHRLLRINRSMHRRAVHLTLHNNHFHNHLPSNHIQHISSQSSVLLRNRFWDAVSSA